VRSCSAPGLPDGIFANQNTNLGKYQEGLAMVDVGIFYGHFGSILVHVMLIWYIFPCFGMFYQEKSGNPGLLCRPRYKYPVVRPICRVIMKLTANETFMTSPLSCGKQAYHDAQVYHRGDPVVARLCSVRHAKTGKKYQMATK
jgi:hypothetical protein